VDYQGSTYTDFVLFDRTLRKHIPSTSLQGKCHEATEENYSVKRMKQEVTPIEDFYQGHAEYTDERLLESSVS
jgi:hypothetical protein